MTIQVWRLLHVFKKIQGAENSQVRIDTETKIMEPYDQRSGNTRSADISRHWSYLSTGIKYMMTHDLLERGPGNVFQLTHSGYHYWQTAISTFLQFLFRSIVVPITVSVLTTIIALWLNGLFSTPH